MSDKSLVLVDGSSYLYRAFHALPDLRSPAGEPTGAIYGVLNMLRRLVNDYKADFLGCVFDAKGKTFRDEMYPEYKANRQAMPDELAAQIEPLMEAIRAMGWPLLVVDGVEADDVIATLAREATNAGLRTVISTGDKDLAQLVDPRVTLINTMSNETLDIAGVKAKFGVAPEKIVDYLALVGDSVDNIPGVDKVGPKTAAKWIAQYGSLEGVLAHADEITGVVGENLRKVRDWLGTARELVTVKSDVELAFKVVDLAPRERDRQQLAALFQRFGFKSWLKEVQEERETPVPAAPAMPAAPVIAPAADVPRKYETLSTEADLARWLERMAGAEVVSFDTETTSLDPFAAKLVGVSFATEAGEAAYLAIDHRYAGAPDQLGVERAVAALRPWLEDPSRKKLGQGLKYDQHVLANHGVRLAGLVHDTLLQSYVLESNARHDMDSLAERYLGLRTITYDEVTGKGAQRIGFEQVDVQRATAYAAEDADVTLAAASRALPEGGGGRKAEARLRNDRDAGAGSAVPDGTHRRADRRRRPRAPGPRARAEDARARAESVRRGRAAVQPQLAQADRRHLLRTPAAPGDQEDAERRAVDRRGRAREARARLPAAEDAARVPGALEAQVDLHRQAAADGERADRPRAHHLRPDDSGDRTAGVERPQPPEHSGAHGRGAADPRSVRGAAGPRHRVGRLLAGRVAHHGAPLGGRRGCSTPSRGARTSTARLRRRSSGETRRS